jgi:hypothetical protein
MCGPFAFWAHTSALGITLERIYVMAENTEPQKTEIQPAPVTTAPVSPIAAAVNRCIAAHNNAYRACALANGDDWDRRNAGKNAYRLAMPRAETVTDVQGFIACVMHGMNLGVFDRYEPNQLLYAAQVALTALKHKPVKKRPTPSPK